MSPAYARKLVKEFEDAVRGRAFEGTVPYFSGNREEQQIFDLQHAYIQGRYKRAKNLLLKHLTGEKK